MTKKRKSVKESAAGYVPLEAQFSLVPLPEMEEEKPHYLGHRQRLRERFMESEGKGIPDYEILELLLFACKPQGDVKPLAKELISKFGSLAKVLTAPPSELLEINGMGEVTVATFKVVREAGLRLLKNEAQKVTVLQGWQQVLDYCNAIMGSERKEQFRVLYLNQKSMLIADEVQYGTIDQAPVYPREIIKRALELHAAHLILVHNHPSGDPKPSREDIEITKQIQQGAAALGILIHDHLIIAGNKHYSFAGNGLL
jgi:DNA repair protein RadC